MFALNIICPHKYTTFTAESNTFRPATAQSRKRKRPATARSPWHRTDLQSQATGHSEAIRNHSGLPDCHSPLAAWGFEF
jgi:hypothetical protein